MGNILSETDAKGNVTSYTYDLNNQVKQITYPDSNTEYIFYDMLGRTVTTYDKESNPTNYSYDKLGRLIDTQRNMEGNYAAETKRYYDKNSNLIKESVKNNAQGGTTQASYTDTEYVYDNMNNCIGIINGGSAVQYWYDIANRVTAMATGLESITPGGQIPTAGSVTRYTYNTLGYVASETDALGQTASYTYDYSGRMETCTDRSGAVTTNVWGPHGMTSSSVTDGSATEKYEYTYNNLGWLTETSSGKTNKYTYDLNSNILTYQLLDGTEVKNSAQYTYDVINQLTQADLNGIIVSRL